MNREVPELSLYELLFIPEGPPETVWERAMEVAFTAVEPDVADGGGPAAEDGESVLEDSDKDADADADADDDHDEDWQTGSGIPEPGPTSETPSWDEGRLLGDGDGDSD